MGLHFTSACGASFYLNIWQHFTVHGLTHGDLTLQHFAQHLLKYYITLCLQIGYLITKISYEHTGSLSQMKSWSCWWQSLMSVMKVLATYHSCLSYLCHIEIFLLCKCHKLKNSTSVWKLLYMPTFGNIKMPQWIAGEYLLFYSHFDDRDVMKVSIFIALCCKMV